MSVNPAPATSPKAVATRHYGDSTTQPMSPTAGTTQPRMQTTPHRVSSTGVDQKKKNVKDSLSDGRKKHNSDSKENCPPSEETRMSCYVSTRAAKSPVFRPHTSPMPQQQHYSTPKTRMVHVEKLHNSTPGYRSTHYRRLDGMQCPETPYTPRSERTYPVDKGPVNPFDHNLVERLNAPMFSPNVFACVNDSDAESPGGFHWNIDQLAMLQPAEINEMPIQQHILANKIDYETECSAQEAIRRYFQQNIIAPSPWLDEKSKTCVDHQPTTPLNTDESSLKSTRLTATATRSVSCQTALTLPVDFDLEKILSSYYNHSQMKDDNVQDLSLCSLRRKLFFHGDQGLSPVRKVTNVESMTLERDVGMSPSPHRQEDCIGIPISAHFSSSPINSKRMQSRVRQISHGSHDSPDQLETLPDSPLYDYSFDESMTFGTPNHHHPMQGTPSTGAPVHGTPFKGAHIQGSPSGGDDQDYMLGYHKEFGGMMESPGMSPIRGPRSPGVTPNYSSSGTHRSTGRSRVFMAQASNPVATPGRKSVGCKIAPVQQRLSFNDDSDDSPGSSRGSSHSSPATDLTADVANRNVPMFHDLMETSIDSDVHILHKLSDIKEATNSSVNSNLDLEQNCVMTSLDIDTNSCDSTGYHTRSSIQTDTCSSINTDPRPADRMSAILDPPQSTNLTNHFGNIEMFGNVSSRAQQRDQGNVQSFAGLFAKPMKSKEGTDLDDDLLDTPKPAAPDLGRDFVSDLESDLEHVDDTGLGLDLEDGHFSGCENVSDLHHDLHHDLGGGGGQGEELDDSMVRERGWKVLGKKRLSRECYTDSSPVSSSTWPPYKTGRHVQHSVLHKPKIQPQRSLSEDFDL